MLDTVFNILKVTVIILVASVFFSAIINLVSLIGNLVFGNIIGEFFSLVSMYLPFDALSVFLALGASTLAILSFMIAKKIFDLTSWSISSV